jgi:hypothetical protein
MSESRLVHAGVSAPVGVQTWVAYSAMEILDRVAVSQSYWWDGGAERLIGWVPDFNARDERNALAGNRTAAVHDGAYLFGESDLWTRFDIATYLLDRFVDEGGTTGPLWVLGGQANLLQNVADVIPVGPSETVGALLRRLITPRLGVDFTVIPIADQGFEVYVFALTARTYSFGTMTLPRNSGLVAVDTTNAVGNIQTRIVKTSRAAYAKLRVVGARAVCCCTLVAPDDLGTKWTAALATAYKAGAGGSTTDPKDHDRARRADRFATVYAAFGAPSDWDHQAGAAAPIVEGDGVLSNTGSSDYQNTVRRTLPWIPLRAGYDYGVSPPLNLNPSGHEGELFAPIAWLLSADAPVYVAAEQVGVHVGVPQFDLGVVLQASPNHLLALNHFSGAAETDTEPAYDYEQMAVTLAFETDHRLALVYQAKDDPAPSDGELDIVDEHAELWYMAPKTWYGLDDTGNPHKTGAGVNTVLRNDAARLYLVMAGAIARHIENRARAEVRIKGLQPWSFLLGHIMTVIEGGGDSHTIGAPITTVEYIGGDRPETIIKTGHAR